MAYVLLGILAKIFLNYYKMVTKLDFCENIRLIPQIAEKLSYLYDCFLVIYFIIIRKWS